MLNTYHPKVSCWEILFFAIFSTGYAARQSNFSVQSLSKILTSEGLTSSPADLAALDRNPLKLMSQTQSGKVAHAVYLLQSH